MAMEKTYRSPISLPPFDNESFAVTYGPLHGYRHLQSEGTAPLFPFGFGLSYTSFSLDDLRADVSQAGAGDTVLFNVDVTNTGEIRVAYCHP